MLHNTYPISLALQNSPCLHLSFTVFSFCAIFSGLCPPLFFFLHIPNPPSHHYFSQHMGDTLACSFTHLRMNPIPLFDFDESFSPPEDSNYIWRNSFYAIDVYRANHPLPGLCCWLQHGRHSLGWSGVLAASGKSQRAKTVTKMSLLSKWNNNSVSLLGANLRAAFFKVFLTHCSKFYKSWIV